MQSIITVPENTSPSRAPELSPTRRNTFRYRNILVPRRPGSPPVAPPLLTSKPLSIFSTMADPDNLSKCTNCAKTSAESGKNLKLCAKCRTTNYCSRECQRADWKSHKKVCTSNAASNAAGPSSVPLSQPPFASATAAQPPRGLSVAIDKPFHRLDSQTWLHGRPHTDVYKLLIDTYRFRMEDNYSLEGEADDDSIYGGALNGERGFQRFLRLAEKRNGLLPPWWSQEKAAECMSVGLNDEWSSLARAIEKSDVTEHYGSPLMAMQLRMFGEQVYGRGPGGQSSASMRQMQMMAERGDGHMSNLDMAALFR